MGTFDGTATCGRCHKEIRSHEPTVPYRNGTLAHGECAPPRGTRQRWSDAKRRFVRARSREPIWTILSALREGTNGLGFLVVEDSPYRVSANGSSTVFVGEIFGAAVQELEDLGFITERTAGIYDLTPEGHQVAENGPPQVPPPGGPSAN